MDEITQEFVALGAQGKRTFLFIYCASRGVFDRQQYMILNSTSDSLYNIEQSCKDVCSQTKNMCTVFSVYDMKKDFLIRYPGLARNSNVTQKLKRESLTDDEETKLPYWHLSSTESLHSTKTQSILAHEILERL